MYILLYSSLWVVNFLHFAGLSATLFPALLWKHLETYQDTRYRGFKATDVVDVTFWFLSTTFVHSNTLSGYHVNTVHWHTPGTICKKKKYINYFRLIHIQIPTDPEHFICPALGQMLLTLDLVMCKMSMVELWTALFKFCRKAAHTVPSCKIFLRASKEIRNHTSTLYLHLFSYDFNTHVKKLGRLT